MGHVPEHTSPSPRHTASGVGKVVRLATLLALLLLAACGAETASPQDDVADEEEQVDPAEPEPAEDEPEVDPDEGAESFEFTAASFIPPTGASVRALDRWTEQVEDATGGRVTVEWVHAGALVGPTEMLEAVADGRIDIGFIGQQYYPAELPLTSVVELPFVTRNGAATALALNELYEADDTFREQYAQHNTHVLSHTGVTEAIVGTNFPVQGAREDLSGSQIRAAGLVGEAVEAIGANVLTVPFPEIYEGLQRGLLDGYTGVTLGDAVAAGLMEVTTHVTDIGTGNFATPVLGINLQVWESLPADLQDAISTVSADLPVDSIQAYVTALDDDQCDDALQEGVEFSQLSEADMEQLRADIGDDIIADWVSMIEEQGLPGQDFFDRYETLVRQYEDTAQFDPIVTQCQ